MESMYLRAYAINPCLCAVPKLLNIIVCGSCSASVATLANARTIGELSHGKGFGRKRSSPKRGSVPAFVWGGLRKTTKILTQNS
jgi:hypothetical protein